MRISDWSSDVCSSDLHMFIHGGYWRSRDKREYSFLAKPLVEAGAAVAIVNYDLCPAVTLDEVVRQLRAACCWLYDHAADYGRDPERLHVSGHSAGSHLTAMMLARSEQPTSELQSLLR